MTSMNGVADLREATPAASKDRDDPSPADAIWLTHSKVLIFKGSRRRSLNGVFLSRRCPATQARPRGLLLARCGVRGAGSGSVRGEVGG